MLRFILEEGRTIENKLQGSATSRICTNQSRAIRVERIEQIEDFKKLPKTISLVVDRIIVKDEDDFYNRLADAIEMAFFEGKGRCQIEKIETSNVVNLAIHLSLMVKNF